MAVRPDVEVFSYPQDGERTSTVTAEQRGTGEQLSATAAAPHAQRSELKASVNNALLYSIA